MQLERIHGRTLQDAMAQVAARCGTDALVVETRRVRDGYVIVAARPAPPVRTAAPSQAPASWSRGFRPLAERGLAFGLAPDVLLALERALRGTRVDLSKPGDPALGSVAARILRALIPVQELALPQARVLALAGPTGVGKTTTLAKIAARCIRAGGERVAIVTLDTFRIAAVEQLRAYAEMLGAPCEVVLTPQDLRRAVAAHAKADRILIDTTGRSPFDRDALAGLAGFLQVARPQTLLCVPAGTRRADAIATIDAYAGLAPAALVLTKWDETRVPGEVLSLAIERGLPLSHLTIGQEVPDDLVVADAGAIAAAVFGLEEACALEVL